MQKGKKDAKAQPTDQTPKEEVKTQVNEEETEKKQMVTKFFANEVTLFGKYKYDVEVKDISLTDLIAVNNSSNLAVSTSK